MSARPHRQHPMRPLPYAVHGWFVQSGTTATLAAWEASWWLIMGLLLGMVVLVVAWLLVWHGDDTQGDDER